MILDPKIWGPHYWFFFHTIALNYPINPNNIIKKKYYDFIINIPIFIPISNIANQFSQILDEFPVTPYLDSRESLIKWFYFIHNKININLEIPEISLKDALHNYFKNYEKKEVIHKNILIKKEKIIFFIVLLILILISIFLYKN